MFNALLEKGNKVMQGVVNLLPAFLIVCFFIFSASANVPPDTSRKIIFLIVTVLLTTHLYLHNKILKLLVYYCVLNLFLVKSNNSSFPYLITIWSVAMFSSFIYRVNRDFKYWGWTLISIYLLSLYCILAVRFNWPNPYYPLSNVRHLHFIQYAGAFTHTIYQGIYSAMLVPISLVLCPVLIIPMLITLWLAHCSTGVFGLLFAISIYLLRVKPKSLLLILPIFSLIFYLYVDKYDSSGLFNELSLLKQQRVEFWIKLLKFEGFSWLGKGLGSFNLIRGFIQGNIPLNNTEFNNAHNFLVQWYYQTGVVGVLLFISYPIYITYRYLRTNCSIIEHMLYASCVVSFISAMWQPSYSVVEVGIPSVIIVTLLERRLNHAKAEQRSEVEYTGESDQASCCTEREVCCATG